jgi:ketosteroid isomerase-like protein
MIARKMACLGRPPAVSRASLRGVEYLLAGLVALLPGIAGAALPADSGVAAGDLVHSWFLQRTQALYDAVARGDKAIWRQTLADDCVVTDEDGQVYGKEAFLDTLTGLPKGFSGEIKIRRLSIRLFGGAAAVHYWIDEHEDALGQKLHTVYVETDTYRRQGNAWKMMAAQVTVVPADLKPLSVVRSGWPKLAGVYRLGEAPGLLYHAYLRNGSLYWGSKAQSAKLLIPLSPLVFFVEGSIHTMVFVRDERGRITAAIELHKYNEIAMPRVRDAG